MRGVETRPAHPELKALVAEAARSLARLDAGRLEELALSCQALNRDLTPAKRKALAGEAHEARMDMAALARVLEATGANLAVMNRLRELHTGRLEYVEGQERQQRAREGIHGVH